MRVRHALRTALFALALAGLSAGPAAAYVNLLNYYGNPKKWSGSSPTVTWTLTTKSMPGVSDDQFKDALQAAFDSWEDVSCATIKFNWGGYKTSTPSTGIHVKVQTGSWDPSAGDALAYAVSQTNFDGLIGDAQVVFNAAGPAWSVSSNPGFGFNDIQGVAAHEIGHAIGLDHSRHFEATMFFSGGSSELRTLEEDDESGACFIYPAVAFTKGQPCDSCATSSQCQGGWCLNWGDGYAFCSTDCNSSSDCEEGFSCYNVSNEIPPQCIPDNEFCHQAGGNIQLGEFCYGHETCASGLCLVSSDTAFCTTECQNSCPFGFVCTGGFCVIAGEKP